MKLFFQPSIEDRLSRAITEAVILGKTIDRIELTKTEMGQLRRFIHRTTGRWPSDDTPILFMGERVVEAK